jgi:hypothetical protein
VLRNKDDTPNPDALGSEEELPGWHDYVEWRKYPEKKKRAKELMKKFNFPNMGSTLFALHYETDSENYIGAWILTRITAKDEHGSRMRETEAIPLCFWGSVERRSGW